MDPPPPRPILVAALLRRAMDDVKLIWSIRDAKTSLTTLLQRGQIGDELWERFLLAEKELEGEIVEVVGEANTFEPGYGQRIFAMASEMVSHERWKDVYENIPKRRAEESEFPPFPILSLYRLLTSNHPIARRQARFKHSCSPRSRPFSLPHPIFPHSRTFEPSPSSWNYPCCFVNFPHRTSFERTWFGSESRPSPQQHVCSSFSQLDSCSRSCRIPCQGSQNSYIFSSLYSSEATTTCYRDSSLFPIRRSCRFSHYRRSSPSSSFSSFDLGPRYSRDNTQKDSE